MIEAVFANIQSCIISLVFLDLKKKINYLNILINHYLKDSNTKKNLLFIYMDFVFSFKPFPNFPF